MTPPRTSNRLLSGIMFYFEPLKRDRNVVMGGVVRGGFYYKLLSTYCVNPGGKFVRMSPRSWGLTQGLQH